MNEIAEDEFNNLAITDYIILNPNSTEDYSLHAYLELPTSSRGYWIEVDTAGTINLVSRFRQIADHKQI